MGKLILTYSSAHYVMSIAINPKDTNTFASACLDRTVKIWNLGSNTAKYVEVQRFTLRQKTNTVEVSLWKHMSRRA